MSDCIFCKIVKGEVPCHKIWEDEKHMAFLSNFPKIDGHTLVIPKEHSINIFDSNEGCLEFLGPSLKKVSSLLKDNFMAEGVNIVNNSESVSGQEVFHTHFHILPRFKEDGRDLKLVGEKKISKELSEVAKKIRGEK